MTRPKTFSHSESTLSISREQLRQVDLNGSQTINKSDTLLANAIFDWFDHDGKGKISFEKVNRLLDAPLCNEDRVKATNLAKVMCEVAEVNPPVASKQIEQVEKEITIRDWAHVRSRLTELNTAGKLENALQRAPKSVRKKVESFLTDYDDDDDDVRAQDFALNLYKVTEKLEATHGFHEKVYDRLRADPRYAHFARMHGLEPVSTQAARSTAEKVVEALEQDGLNFIGIGEHHSSSGGHFAAQCVVEACADKISFVALEFDEELDVHIGAAQREYWGSPRCQKDALAILRKRLRTIADNTTTDGQRIIERNAYSMAEYSVYAPSRMYNDFENLVVQATTMGVPARCVDRQDPEDGKDRDWVMFLNIEDYRRESERSGTVLYVGGRGHLLKLGEPSSSDKKRLDLGDIPLAELMKARGPLLKARKSGELAPKDVHRIYDEYVHDADDNSPTGVLLVDLARNSRAKMPPRGGE